MLAQHADGRGERRRRVRAGDLPAAQGPDPDDQPVLLPHRARVPRARRATRRRSSPASTPTPRGGPKRAREVARRASRPVDWDEVLRRRDPKRTRSSIGRSRRVDRRRARRAPRSTCCATSRSRRTSRPASSCVLGNDEDGPRHRAHAPGRRGVRAVRRGRPRRAAVRRQHAHRAARRTGCATAACSRSSRRSTSSPAELADLFGLHRPRPPPRRCRRRRRGVRPRDASTPARSAACATCPATRSASSPTSPRHRSTCSSTAVAIHRDGESVATTTDARPGTVLRGATS